MHFRKKLTFQPRNYSSKLRKVSEKQAVKFVTELYRAGVDIAVFEQPVWMFDIEGLKYVRWNSPFPVAADESARTKFDVLRLIKEEAVDYVNIKLMKSGISDALAIVEMARSANLRLMIGCMAESSLGVNQSVYFALGTGTFDFYNPDSLRTLKPRVLEVNVWWECHSIKRVNSSRNFLSKKKWSCR